MTVKLSNWAGHYTYTAARIHYPETVAEVQEIVRGGRKVKALGSRHSFNHIADSTEDLVSLERFPTALTLDREHKTVTLAASVKYGQISEELYQEGYALHNLASLPHISVAGACATATHGSGVDNGSLATAVAALEFVQGDGELVRLSREDGDKFNGAVVNLGGLGIITSMTLDVVPAFDVRQNLYENLAWDQLLPNFDAVMSRAYSVSLFTDWRGDRINQVWIKSQVDPSAQFEAAPDLFGALPAPARRHPIGDLSAEACTEQLGIPGPWYERLPHFRMDFTPSNGEELQSEFFVPAHHAVAALETINRLRDRIAPILHITEVRSIAADNLWMSPSYQQPVIGIHFTWKKDWDRVSAILPTIQDQLAQFEARPHWGKLFTMDPTLVQSRFARLQDFRDLLTSHDPQGKFRNDFLDTYVF